MRQIINVGCVLVLMGAAFEAGEIVRAERLIVLDREGKPKVVAMTDVRGNGELVIYDSEGRVLFGIQGGRFVGKLASELRRIDTAIAAKPGIAAGPTLVRVMLLESVSTLPVDDLMLAEAAKLRAEAKGLDDEIHDLEKAIARIPKTGITERDEKNLKHRRNEYKQLKLGYEQDAKRFRARATRLDKQAHETRHELQGWDGQRTIILETTRDLSVTISRLNAGDFVTWQGKRVEMTDNTDRFQVNRIEGTAAPANFRTRSGKGTP